VNFLFSCLSLSTHEYDRAMKYFFISAWIFLSVFCPSSACPQSAPQGGQRPVLTYTDITSGPNSGGENNKGIYLSLFGKNFGTDGSGRTTKVFIGNAEVAEYRGLSTARGRSDIQQLTVQVGALGNPKVGIPLPIKVVVNGVESNNDLTFTVNPGRILFVDNVKGNDRTATPGDIHHPFRHVQTSRLQDGAWGKTRPGDFIILRGTGVPWTDHGFDNYFLRVRDKSGTAPKGIEGSGPIGVMGYPGEDVFINQPYSEELEKSGSTGGISAVNGLSLPGMGQWVVISNLRIEGGGHDGAINIQIRGNHWRIVNNELSAATAVNNSDAKAAGIAGNGFGETWLGNYIHDVYCGPANTGPLQNHGIYIDGEGSYEIAYNTIKNIFGGNGFQTYVNGSNGSDTTGDINFHHNFIADVGKHGINIADNTGNGVRIFNNIVVNTRYAGLRFNTGQLHRARIYNNTFYHTNMAKKQRYGAVMNDAILPADAIDLENNIFVPFPDTDYAGGSVGFGGKAGIVNRNFWHGGKGDTSFDAYAQTGELEFIAEGRDFHVRPGSWTIDAGSPSVARIVVDDYGLTTRRPQGLGFDIGAYETSH
jgi:hypothetical protein